MRVAEVSRGKFATNMERKDGLYPPASSCVIAAWIARAERLKCADHGLSNGTTDMRIDGSSEMIRRARHEDLDALLALEAACFDTDRLSRRQYRHHIVSTSALVLVSGVTPLEASAVVFFRRTARVARLYSLATLPQARGRGLASALLGYAMNAAKARGCDRLRLEVRVDNTAAIALYEHAGFRRFGRYLQYYQDATDAWRYERRLD